jgi:hypothetical protein
MALTTNQGFDAYAARHGWAYDNGGTYGGECWDWYARETPGGVLMRQAPDRVALVRFQGTAPTEIWSGRIETTTQFDELMEILADYAVANGLKHR